MYRNIYFTFVLPLFIYLVSGFYMFFGEISKIVLNCFQYLKKRLLF